MFKKIEEVRAFELLRTSQDRSNYMLTNEARIVAMTCTHASLKVPHSQLSFREMIWLNAGLNLTV